MRIVLDQIFLFVPTQKTRGPARELLQSIAGSRDHVLLLSPFLQQELERVFSYSASELRRSSRTARSFEYLSYLRAKDVSEIVFPGPAPRVVPADPDDDPVVHAAVVGRADGLCAH